MKEKPHSFAYFYAKQRLKDKIPKYAPLFSLIAGLITLALAFARSKLEVIPFIPPALLLLSALDSWIEQGKREVFEELNRQLEEAGIPKEEPNQSLQRNASTGSASSLESPARHG